MDGMGGLIIMMVLLLGIMYFLMVRPQRKQMQEQERLLNELQPGARVLLANGMFATLREVGEQQMIVELAPGVEVAILRQIVRRPAHDDEEEFEFVDGLPTATGLPEGSDEIEQSGVRETELLVGDAEPLTEDPYYGAAEISYIDSQDLDDTAGDDGQVR